jgi:hypothetical protein
LTGLKAMVRKGNLAPRSIHRSCAAHFSRSRSLAILYSTHMMMIYSSMAKKHRFRRIHDHPAAQESGQI